jgi:peptidoglycan/xylan/chitin deacetylase (PgdA/CDA1 family)
MKSLMHHTLVTLREKALAPFKTARLQRQQTHTPTGLRILNFHGIDDNNSTRHNTRFISRKKFEALLGLLKQHTHVFSLTDALAGKIDEDQLNIALTFDDGYYNNLSHALPLLERYQMPAAIFCTCVHLADKDILVSDLYDLCCDRLPRQFELGNITFSRNAAGTHITKDGKNIKPFTAGCGKEFLLDLYRFMEPYATFRKNPTYDQWWKLLSPADLTRLGQHPLITIGSHGVMHLNYPFVGNSAAMSDMKESKTELERLTAAPVDQLAFPFGTYTPELINIAHETDYHSVYIDTPDGAVPEGCSGTHTRFGINPFISAAHQFLYIKKGSY